MPGEKKSMVMTKFMSIRGQIVLILALFLPICSVGVMARWLPDDPGWKILLLSLAWLVLALVFFVIYENIRVKKAAGYTMSLEGSHLRLLRGDRVIKEFNLSESHRLLVIVSNFTDKENLFFQRFADVHLSQGSERLSFRLFLIMEDAEKALRSGEESRLSCAVERGRVGNRLFLWVTANPHLHQYQWEGRYTGKPALNFLKALDSFSASNALLPDIEKARAGGMGLSELKRRALG